MVKIAEEISGVLTTVMSPKECRCMNSVMPMEKETRMYIAECP